MDSKSVVNNVAAGGMKKGPWTAAEDAILMEYVRKHGEGNWNSVQKNSGLMRCGKSCRLRWANHLRPNLKKGSFSPGEERIILELHAKLGNKWARMASQLPGRTDNEIKNFWNTRMKRRQRAGLPLYPQTLQELDSTTNHPQHHQQKNPNSSPFSSLVSYRKSAYNPPPPLLDSITFSPAFDPLQNNFQNASFYCNPTLQFKPFPEQSTTNLSLPLSPVPHQYATTTPPQPSSLSSFCYNNGGFDNNMSFTSLVMDDNQTSGGVITGVDPELPSSQTPAFVAQNETQEPLIHEESRSSGLLDTLLMESENLVRKEKMNGEDLLDKEKRKMEEEEESRKRVKLGSTNSGVASATILSCEDITSSHSSIGTKQISEEPVEEMNTMDDDLLSLLDNFPTTSPLPEWYRTRNVSDGMSSGTTGDVQAVEAQRVDLPARAESPIVEWGLGTSPSYWNNMPSIC